MIFLRKKGLLISLIPAFLVSCGQQENTQSQTKEFVKTETQQAENISLSLNNLREYTGISAQKIKTQKAKMNNLEEQFPEPLAYLTKVQFVNLTSQEFENLKNYLGSWAPKKSQISFTQGATYSLEDFLPPQFQAIINHRFKTNYIQNFSINTTEAYPASVAFPMSYSFMTNCWTTVYTLLSSIFREENQMSFFMVNYKISDYLENNEYSQEIPMNETKPGDILIVRTRMGNKTSIAHAAIKISDDLYFEKSAWASDVSYRFVSYQEIVDNYGDTEDTKYIYRRFGKPGFQNFSKKLLPTPAEAFSVKGWWGKNESLYSSALQNIIVELPFPNDYMGNPAYGIKTLPFTLENGKGKLTSEAYKAETFLPANFQKNSPFSDLQTSPFKSEILEAYDRKLVAGFPGGKFMPESQVTRAQLVAFALSLASNTTHVSLNIPSSLSEAPFPDVPATHWAATRIAYSKSNKIVSGFPDGTFGPDAPVTHAQAIVVLAGAVKHAKSKLGLAQEVGRPQIPMNYNDIPSHHWAKSTIENMTTYCFSAHPAFYDRGGQPFFQPDKPAKREWVTAAMLRAWRCLNQDVSGFGNTYIELPY